MATLRDAKAALEKIIRKSRVHLYKPIQIAEILRRDRIDQDIDCLRLKTYRNPSKAWRDEVSRRLLNRVCTSSQKFQDNLFERNALLPKHIQLLATENRRTDGGIETYIYKEFAARQNMVQQQIAQLAAAEAATFDVDVFIGGFTASPGLRRSVDKAYEIVVYALFDTIVSAIGATVTIQADDSAAEILHEFEDFTTVVLGIDSENSSRTIRANLYRVGATNAADRGLDMWANFGPAIQVKHLSFTESMAEDIVGQVSADEIVIVCRDGEADGIERILRQLGFADRVRGVFTQSDLRRWYDKCLTGRHCEQLAEKLLENLRVEFHNEFPSCDALEDFLAERGYEIE